MSHLRPRGRWGRRLEMFLASASISKTLCRGQVHQVAKPWGCIVYPCWIDESIDESLDESIVPRKIWIKHRICEIVRNQDIICAFWHRQSCWPSFHPLSLFRKQFSNKQCCIVGSLVQIQITVCWLATVHVCWLDQAPECQAPPTCRMSARWCHGKCQPHPSCNNSKKQRKGHQLKTTWTTSWIAMKCNEQFHSKLFMSK